MGNNIIEYIISNKEWLFSGIAVSIISFLASVFINKTQQNTTKENKRKHLEIALKGKSVTQDISGDENIFSGSGNVNITIGDKTDAEIINEIEMLNNIENQQPTKK